MYRVRRTFTILFETLLSFIVWFIYTRQPFRIINNSDVGEIRYTRVTGYLSAIVLVLVSGDLYIPKREWDKVLYVCRP